MLTLERSERTRLFTPFRAEFLSTMDSQKGTTGMEGSGKAPEPILFWNKSQDGVRVMKKLVEKPGSTTLMIVSAHCRR